MLKNYYISCLRAINVAYMNLACSGSNPHVGALSLTTDKAMFNLTLNLKEGL